jgi:hypothetical protein
MRNGVNILYISGAFGIEFRDKLPKSKVGKLFGREIRDDQRHRKEA